ncbi:MAG: hypothetical protein PUP91_09835 [Rhizonema sp. PD37]|nr:hypothetical protein [Rhizonema sp. PD37]
MAITLIPSSRQQTQHIFLEGVTWATDQRQAGTEDDTTVIRTLR